MVLTDDLVFECGINKFDVEVEVLDCNERGDCWVWENNHGNDECSAIVEDEDDCWDAEDKDNIEDEDDVEVEDELIEELNEE